MVDKSFNDSKIAMHRQSLFAKNINKSEFQTHTSKPYLQNIEKAFSVNPLNFVPSAKFAFYPYANEIQQLPINSYLSKFNTIVHTIKNDKNIGLVVGNGYILSLLPDLPVNDVILADIEPAVHHFIFYVKNLIINCNEENFEKKRALIQSEINQYIAEVKKYKLLNDEESLATEIESLGEKHFLYSEERFNICKKALLEKELLPIKLDLLDYHAVNKFAKLLIAEKLKISFINITNVADYDRFRILPSNLMCLPLASDFAVISTSLVSIANCDNHFPKDCLIADNVEKLNEILLYSYQRNIRYR